MRHVVLLVLASALLCAPTPAVQAQDELASDLELGTPYSPLVRRHFYEQLAKRPGKALGWELLAPGAGNLYTGLFAPAAGTLGLSLLGASLWIAGGLRDRPGLLWTGVGTFAVARAYGLVSAPLGALMLNAAFRRQLGISGSY